MFDPEKYIHEQKGKSEKDKNELESNIMSLNTHQKKGFDVFLTGKHMFITGSAGCGKTYLMNTIIKYCQINDINIAVTATTGISSTLLNGMTIHSWSGLQIMDKPLAYYKKSIAGTQKYAERWRSVKVLLIDEVSMMDIKLFESLDEIARLIRGIDIPFGGIQVILGGDFCQLQPVKEDKYCFQSPLWKQLPKVVLNLTKSIRHEDDELFTNFLNKVRYGIYDKTYEPYINECLNRKIDSDCEIIPTKLYSYRADVSNINNEELQKLLVAGNELHSFTAKESFMGKFTETAKTNTLETFYKNTNYQKILHLCKDLQVMCIRNIQDLGLVNGSRGVIVGFEESGNKYPIVKFMNGEKITIKPLEHKSRIDEHKSISVVQIPLMIAYAITIHKAQSCTLDLIQADLGEKIFAYGQMYTALSRVRNFKSLYLIRFDKTKILASPSAVKYYENLKYK